MTRYGKICSSLTLVLIVSACSPGENPSGPASASQSSEPETEILSPKDIANSHAPAVVHLFTESGSGTGFVVDSSEGIVVTNAHVISGAGLLKAGLSNGEQVSARVLGSAPCEDLAVVQLNEVPEEVAEVELGDSEELVSQDSVTAMGYPAAFGDQDTQDVVTTSGAVQSPKLAAEPNSSTPNFASLIQHDATINPGNSGGPLFNDKGQVVGINTLGNTLYNQRTIQGQYYAISINRAKTFIDKLTEGESISDIGLTGLALSDADISGIYPEGDAIKEVLLDNGLDGLVVASVTTGGPADNASIFPGDLILSANGVDTTSFSDLCDVLASASSGDNVTLRGMFLEETGDSAAGELWEAAIEPK